MTNFSKGYLLGVFVMVCITILLSLIFPPNQKTPIEIIDDYNNLIENPGYNQNKETIDMVGDGIDLNRSGENDITISFNKEQAQLFIDNGLKLDKILEVLMEGRNK